MTEVPRIISVDDHVVEPPDLWSSRLPAKYQDRGPRIKRQKITLGGPTTGGGGMTWVEDTENGVWSDVWYYDDLVSPLMMLSAAVGFDEVAHYYRPAGKPRSEQPWLATVFRRA